MIVGAGFGGLWAAKQLRRAAVEVLLIDKHNYHTFTPLLYQVATSALDPSEIGYPIRSIFRKDENVRVLLGEVTGIDHEKRFVTVQTEEETRREPYDYLILAAGSVPAYFGNEAFQQHAFDLRTLEDAIRLRNHVLKQFERAAWTDDPELCDALTTIVVVGGGPTGLETAGAIYELYNHVLDSEYTHGDLRARVVLVEMLPYLLAPYPEKLRAAAVEQLGSLGVEVRVESPVVEVTEREVRLGDGTTIPTFTLVWSAGVKAAPITSLLGVELDKAGRVPVKATMEVIGRERIYAVGDLCLLEDEAGEAYPMMIPPAIQQGRLAAENILAAMRGKAQRPFRYSDRGMMATIGRSRAVAWLYKRLQLRGLLAWLVWLVFHLYSLIGFRNRLTVLVNWAWTYFTYDRSVRIILEGVPAEEDKRERHRN